MQAGLAFENDQRSHIMRCHMCDGLNDIRNHRLQPCVVAALDQQERAAAQLFECTAQFRLEEHRDAHQECREQALDQPRKSPQLYQAREQSQRDKQGGDTAHQWNGACPLNGVEDQEEEKRHNQDIQAVNPGETLKQPH